MIFDCSNVLFAYRRMRNSAPDGRSITVFHYFANILRVSASPREIFLGAYALRAISPATQPALNPASILTTATLDAQELSMPSRAERPPKFAP